MTVRAQRRLPFVVTGVGLVSAAGDSPTALFEALLAGKTFVRSSPEPPPVAGVLTEGAAAGTLSGGAGASAPPEGAGAATFPEGARAGSPPDGPSGQRSRVTVAPIEGFDPKSYLKRKGLKDLSRTSLLACCAASRLAGNLADVAGSRIGVAFGTAWGSLRTVIDFERAAFRDGPRFVDPLLFTETVSNVPAGQVAIVLGWSAFNVTVSAGSASGLEAIRTAIDLLEDGRADIAVAGGGDELNLPILRSLASESAQPPGGTPEDLFGGEGACWLVIESGDGARSRGAAPLARIVAIEGKSGVEEDSDRRDAHHSDRSPDRSDGRSPDGATERIARLIRDLLDAGAVCASDIDLVVLSMNGAAAAGRAEALAVEQVLGGADGSPRPAAVAPKAVLGETWGAAGVLGAAVAIEAMRSGTIPPWPRGPGREAKAGPGGIELPAAPLGRRVRRALVLDTASRGGGHLYGLVLESAAEADHGV